MATQREAILTHLRSLGADLPDVKTETLENFMEAYEPITPEQEEHRADHLPAHGGW